MKSPSSEKQASPLEIENLRLQRSLDELAYLNSLAAQIGGIQTSSEIIEVIVRQAVRKLGAEQGAITLVDRESDHPLKTLVRSKRTELNQPSYHFHQMLLGWMIMHREPIRIETTRDDERFSGMEWEPGVRSVLAAPLLVKGAVTGVLAVYNKSGGGVFSDDDQRLLSIIGSQSAQVIESARLAEEELELRLLKEDMRVASYIQRSLLPGGVPSIEGYEIAGAYVPAELIGGDYYDYLPLKDGRWGIVIADVSGKGIPAAMFMSVGRTLMRMLAQSEDRPGACISAMNEELCAESADAMFITVLYGVLDPANHSFTYASAGHEAPFLISGDGGVEALPRTGGLLLGIFTDQRYREFSCTLSPGDKLLLFTDGVTEATDKCGKLLGETGLANIISEAAGLSASETVSSVLSAVDSFACPDFKRDDLTMVVISRIRPIFS